MKHLFESLLQQSILFSARGRPPYRVTDRRITEVPNGFADLPQTHSCIAPADAPTTQAVPQTSGRLLYRKPPVVRCHGQPRGTTLQEPTLAMPAPFFLYHPIDPYLKLPFLESLDTTPYRDTSLPRYVLDRWTRTL